MNIFEALRQGNGSINETNVTGFLSYLLDHPSDIRKSFVILFLESIDGMMNFLDIKENSHSRKVNDFFTRYELNVQPEFRMDIGKLEGKKAGTIIPDILIEIESKNNTPKCYIIVENKIQKMAAKNDQLVEQYKALQKIESYSKGTPIFSLLLTTGHNAFIKMFDEIKLENKNYSTWMFWTTNIEGSKTVNSIENIIKSIFDLDINMEIHPINDKIKYLLKSFVSFLKTLEKVSNNKRSEKEDCSCVDIEEFAEINISPDYLKEKDILIEESEIIGKHIFIKRTRKSSILLCDENGVTYDKNVKRELRNIIKLKELSVSLNNSKNGEKNTRTLGKDVIRALNDL